MRQPDILNVTLSIVLVYIVLGLLSIFNKYTCRKLVRGEEDPGIFAIPCFC